MQNNNIPLTIDSSTVILSEMGSSEIVDSGRFSGGARSNFSHTCNLLSQYLKEKGSFGDLTLGLTPTIESKGAPTETMNLLSMIEKSGSRNLHAPPPVFSGEIPNKADLSDSKPEVGTAPLTIFYGGQIIVFNDFPADRAEEIMSLARKSGATRNHPNAAFAPPHAAQSPAESTTTTAVFGIRDLPPRCAQPSLDSDLPIARKNSLARFLEKRRDRITANAPYPTTKQSASPPPNGAKTEAWLGLSAPQLPHRIQRH